MKEAGNMESRRVVRFSLHFVAGALAALLFASFNAPAQQPQAQPKRPVVGPRQTGAQSAQPAKTNAVRPQAGNSNPQQHPQQGSYNNPSNPTQNGAAPCNAAAPGRPGYPGRGQTAAAPCNSTSQGQDNRQPLNAADEGIGNFPGGGGYNMTLYSCFRSGSQVLCDFDVWNQHNVLASARNIYGDLRLVNSSGRMFPHNDAFFVDTDGSQFDASQIMPGNKVRLIMVFNNVPASLTNVSLAQGPTIVQGVGITAQEAGTQAAAAGGNGQK
jgi:hypothetical protein